MSASLDLQANLIGRDAKWREDLRSSVRDQLLAGAVKDVDPLSFARALPALERPLKKRPFVSQGPYGFRRGVGFLDRDNGKGGWTIEYAGSTGTPLAEEMLLLRAAQLARERGAATFTVTSRHTSKRLQEASMDVVFNAAGGPSPALAIDADQVWTDLAPFYVQLPEGVEK
jgi:hypothetical protein